MLGAIERKTEVYNLLREWDARRTNFLNSHMNLMNIVLG